MDKVKKYQAIIKKFLQSQSNILIPTIPKIEYQVIVDNENNHFQLVMRFTLYGLKMMMIFYLCAKNIILKY